MNYLKCFFHLSAVWTFSYGKILNACFRILLVTILFIPCFIKPSPAMDYLIGAKGGYFVWDPYLKRVDSSMFNSLAKGEGQLYGPVFSAMFTPDLSFSVSGLFGQQKASWTTVDFTRLGNSHLLTGTYSMTTDRIDIDSALSYRFTENFKVFAGYKYQNFHMKMEMVEFGRDGGGLKISEHTNVDIKMPFHGPALGIGYSTPIGERYFFASNLSALYMWGKFDFEMKGYQYTPGPSTSTPISGPGDSSGITMKSRGINFEPTIGASMGEGMPIFTLGIRGQWSQTRFINGEKLFFKERWADDYQYGIFVSIMQPF